MGRGKTIKYPKRQKYVPPQNKVEIKQEPVSEEEHRKRIEKLKELGLLK